MSRLLLVAILVLAFVPATAAAATVESAGGRLVVVDGTGEDNDLTVTPDGTSVVVHDDLAALTAGSGCAPEPPAPGEPATGVRCAAASRVAADLGGGADMLRATRFTLRAAGGAGDDSIDGGRGADRIAGGPGDDILAGYGGPDRISGGAGRDSLGGDDGNDRIDGGAGRDDLRGGAGDDRVSGGGGDDVLDGGVDDDVVHGGAGDDRVDDFYGRDRLFGDAGADRVDAIDGLRDVVISCGPGRDRALADRLPRDRNVLGCERIRRGDPVSEGNVPA